MYDAGCYQLDTLSLDMDLFLDGLDVCMQVSSPQEFLLIRFLAINHYMYR